MSSILQILPFLGAFLGVVATVYAAVRTARQRRAEAKLRHRLLQDADYQALLRKQRNLLTHAQAQAMSEEEVAILLPLISEELQHLTEQDSAWIKEALYQPSLSGRTNYLSKLVAESSQP